MIRLGLAIAVATCASLGPVGAQVPGTADTARPASQIASASADNEIVCQKIRETGSRLAIRKVCKTRAEWADLKLQDRQNLEQAQTQRGMAK